MGPTGLSSLPSRHPLRQHRRAGLVHARGGLAPSPLAIRGGLAGRSSSTRPHPADSRPRLTRLAELLTWPVEGRWRDAARAELTGDGRAVAGVHANAHHVPGLHCAPARLGAAARAPLRVSVDADRGVEQVEQVTPGGEPIGEPVVQLGSFVMNTEEEIDMIANNFEC